MGWKTEAEEAEETEKGLEGGVCTVTQKPWVNHSEFQTQELSKGSQLFRIDIISVCRIYFCHSLLNNMKHNDKNNWQNMN